MQLAYEALWCIWEIKKTENMPIADYEAEFQWLYNRAKSYVMVLSYSTWAHMFLNSGSISVSNERLMLATFTDSSYETMKT